MKNLSYGRIKNQSRLMMGCGLAAAFLVMVSGAARAAVLEATPKLIIDLYYNDNIYGSDSSELETPLVADDEEDIATATYIHYLAGILFRYRQGPATVELSGDAGYTQYLSIGGWVTDADDNQASDYNSMHAQATGAFRYSTKQVIFEIDDTIHITRNLQDIFGMNVDAFGYWTLYTDNVIGVNVKYSPSPKARLLARYSYDTLTFTEPENDVVAPPDSVEQRAIGRVEYDFTGKLTGIVDGQYVSRYYDDVDDREFADYTMFLGYGGVRYRFNSQAYLEALGGYYSRSYTDLNEQVTTFAGYPTPQKMFDLEDVSNPLAKVKFVVQEAQSYLLDITGDYGVSTYGQDLYFTYTGVSANFIYYITPKLNINLYGAYSQSLYDLDQNSREWQWDDDRVDNITQANARITWDILQKGGQGTLSVAAGYALTMRDSNVDSRSDYNPIYQNWQLQNHLNDPLNTSVPQNADWPYDSFDATMNVFYVEVVVLPTILLGD